MSKARDLAQQPNAITTAANGNVGIGTSSPDARLRVSGGSNSLQARFSGADSRGLAISTFASVGTNDNGVTYNAGVTSDAQHVWQCGGTERMRIDSAGRVTMPSQPMFQAMLQSTVAGNTNVASSDVYQYSSVRINRGSHFNNSNYRFTAPITGVYVIGFSASFFRSSTAGRRAIGLFVNGTIREYVDITPNQDYDIVELQTLISLNANDFVDVRQNTAFSGDQYWGGAGGSSPVGSFRGYLLG